MSNSRSHLLPPAPASAGTLPALWLYHARYDAENRLGTTAVAGSGVEQYGYGPDNRRVYKRNMQTNEERFFFWSGGQVIAVLAPVLSGQYGDLAGFTTIQTYKYLGSRRIGERPDRLGSDVNGGKNYFSYGEEKTVTAGDAYKFATYYRDSATNLDYADQRYYKSGNFGHGFDFGDPVHRYPYDMAAPLEQQALDHAIDALDALGSRTFSSPECQKDLSRLGIAADQIKAKAEKAGVVIGDTSKTDVGAAMGGKLDGRSVADAVFSDPTNKSWAPTGGNTIYIQANHWAAISWSEKPSQLALGSITHEVMHLISPNIHDKAMSEWGGDPATLPIYSNFADELSHRGSAAISDKLMRDCFSTR